jgi:hypothetical protein
MREGRIAGALTASEATRETIMALATSVHARQATA